MHKVFIQSYNAEVEVSAMVVSSSLMDNVTAVARLFEAIGFNSQFVFTAKDEEELEAFIPHYALIFCNNFQPSQSFIDRYPDIKFINSFDRGGNMQEEINKLADFTGISSFKNLVYDSNSQFWVNFGQASVRRQHNPIALTMQYSKEVINWIASGRPIRDEETIKLLFDTFCSRCSEFIPGDSDTDGSCNICGCSINLEPTMFNKLGMGTTNCPMEPPKWRTGIEVSPETIEGRQTELFAEYLQLQQEQYGPQGQPKYCPEQQNNTNE